MKTVPYDRESAVRYAHKWAHGRNPRYYNFDPVGGDCTNFASQCLLAGGAVMDYTPDFGWYYLDANRKAPAWSGVEYLYAFLTRNQSVGPFGRVASREELSPGDLVQMSFGGRFQHTPVVVETGGEILVAAHTYDCDYAPLSSFGYSDIRYIKILGVRRA